MKRIYLMLMFVSLCWSAKTQALLSPYYESLREIKEILESKDLAQSLGGGYAITSIVKTEKGYTVSDPFCTVNVGIAYLKTHQIGPAQYQFKLGKKECEKPVQK